MPSAIQELLFPILEKYKADIEDWFTAQYRSAPPFLYSSVDVRHAGYKLAPVDTNLFPAGFNLMPERQKPLATEQMQRFLQRYFPRAKNLLLIPENHTRNLFYLDNVAAIYSLLENAGYTARIASFAYDATNPVLTSANSSELKIHPVERNGNQIHSGDFIPDVVVLNNDLSTGIPPMLEGIEQPITPPLSVGWYQRSKTSHFETYGQIVREFAQIYNIDPWLMSTVTTRCGKIDFKTMSGLECLALNTERTLKRITEKYAEYGITEKPYVFIKADHGTYGMGIMTAYSADEVMELNKKARNKMNVIKEGVVNSDVIIQEGIPTIDRVDGKVAEPLMYLIGGVPVSCTYRVNEERDSYGNLNSSGMSFRDACEKDVEDSTSISRMCPVQGFIARLASLAATRECYEANWSI